MLIRSKCVSSVKLRRRFLSSPALAINESVSAESLTARVCSTRAPTAEADIGKPTLRSILSKAPSQGYFHSIAHPTFTPSKLANTEKAEQTNLIKEKIQGLVETENYETLLDFLLHWARAGSQDTSMVLIETISKEEISQLVAKIIRSQISTLHEFTLNAPIKKARTGSKLSSKLDNARTDANYVKSRELLSKIRQLFSSLLYSDKQEFIYHHQKRQNLYSSYSATGYELSVNDYENLIFLEMNNLKLDLASKWFEHFARQFPHNSGELMTYKMWMMKFQIYSGGSPSFWKVPETELSSETFYNPTKGFFNNEIPFPTIFNDFLTSFKKSGKKLVLNNDFNETLVYSVGYSKNVEYLHRFIQSRYGLDTQGNMSASFKKLDISDPSYPTFKIVKAAFVALAFNSRFYEGLKLINSFQRHYDINLSEPKARTFWEQIFRWGNITTKFDEKKSLAHYLRQSAPSSQRRNTLLTLEEAKEDADFDYVGYLNFIKDLEKQRIDTFQSLWKLYLDNNGYFSKFAFKLYLDFLKEELDVNQVESNYFEYLSLLSGEWNKYQTSSESFNKRTDVHLRTVKDFDVAIYTLYMETMKGVLDCKWKAMLAGQCQPIIDKWSLDSGMQSELTNWFNEVRLPQYREMMEKKREDFMVELRTEEKDEPFLDLM